MNETSVVCVYLTVSLNGPRRFVVHKRASDGIDIYEQHAPQTIREYLTELFTVLAAVKTDFMALLAERDDHDFMNSRQERRFIAKEKDTLYIGSPHLTDLNSSQHLGYWIGTNINRKQAHGLARAACSIAAVPSENIKKLPVQHGT